MRKLIHISMLAAIVMTSSALQANPLEQGSSVALNGKQYTRVTANHQPDTGGIIALSASANTAEQTGIYAGQRLVNSRQQTLEATGNLLITLKQSANAKAIAKRYGLTIREQEGKFVLMESKGAELQGLQQQLEKDPAVIKATVEMAGSRMTPQ